MSRPIFADTAHEATRYLDALIERFEAGDKAAYWIARLAITDSLESPRHVSAMLVALRTVAEEDAAERN
jgi:hypothetical protein